MLDMRRILAMMEVDDVDDDDHDDGGDRRASTHMLESIECCGENTQTTMR